MKYKLIFYNTSLEIIPKEIKTKIPKKLRDKFKFNILDSNYHYKWMYSLENFKNRGRPDIIYLSLLSVLESPLNRLGLLEIYVHTLENKVFKIDSKVRLPRNYFRFLGIWDKILSGNKNPFILYMGNYTIGSLLEKIKSKKICVFSKSGKMLEKINILKNYDTFIIGALEKCLEKRSGSIVADVIIIFRSLRFLIKRFK